MKYPPALNPLRNTQFAWLLPLTWAFLKCAAVTAPTTVEVFLHDNFGCRTGRSLLKGFLLLVIVAPVFRSACRPPAIPLFGFFILAYTWFAFCEWIDSRTRVAGDPVHSQQHGEPWAFWSSLPVSRRMVECVIEPLLCFVMAMLTAFVDSALAHWFLIAAGALGTKAIVRDHEIHTQQLDALDGRIDANRHAPRPRTENDDFVEARPAPPHLRGNNR